MPKAEPVRPLPDEALKRVAGGAKNPGWKPVTGGTTKTREIVTKSGEVLSSEGKTCAHFIDGDLEKDVANSFMGSIYTKKILKEDTVLYRVYGGQANKIGSYLSRTPQNGGLQSQIDLALNPTWGNTTENVSKVIVPKGTVIYEGIAAPQHVYDSIGNIIGEVPGGGNQIFILRRDMKEAWFK